MKIFIAPFTHCLIGPLQVSPMNRLWTPWRFAYVTESSSSLPECIFCRALEGGDDPLIVHRGRACFVILNKFPYNNGHLMIVPNLHLGRLSDLNAETLAEFAALTQASERALAKLYDPHGFNMG